MKFKLFLLTLLCTLMSYSQCFDCGQNIGGHVDDFAMDLDKTTDGIILSSNINQLSDGLIQKYDFNCNLTWSINLVTDNYNLELEVYKTAVAENDNIYAIVSNPFNTTGIDTLNGNPIPYGMNIIKIDSSGNVIWVRFIGGLARNIDIHYWNDNLFIVGQFYTSININNQINLTSTNPYRAYIAKFNTSGVLLNADQYGAGESYLLSSEIDNDGNIYFAGTVYNGADDIYGHLTKVNSNLVTQWSNSLGSNNSSVFPRNMYYNETNNRLYVWCKYSAQVNVLGVDLPESDCGSSQTSSIIFELETGTGNLQNYFVFDNCGPSGINNMEKGFMTYQDNQLYVLSSFRGNVILGNTNLSSTNNNGALNRNLILYSINLDDFSTDVLLTSSGTNYWGGVAYNDFPASIQIEGNNLFLSSTFMSSPIQINGMNISNNSGNNNTDVLLFKYKLDQIDLSSSISYENTCFNGITDFYLEGFFDSVLWNFDDPTSGVNNTSTLNNPSHTFTNIGNFNVTALVTCGTETETLNIEVVITNSPSINQISDLYACEDIYGSQISSTFNTSSIENELIGSQSDLTIKYFDSNGIELPSPLPNPMSNSILGEETITARVSYNNNLTCFTEVSFDLIVNPLPEINEVNNIYACDDDYDGITDFDISNLETIISDNQSGMVIEFFHENGQQLTNPLPDTIQNMVLNQETITARITNPNSNCYNESTFDLIVNPLPVVNELQIFYGCDDNSDGISEYFDTSNIESQVLNGQTGMSVSYFDQNGNELPSPLPNPYTNANAFNELITVRVTDNFSTCYAETTLQLQTVTQPNISQPENLYACDQGSGYSEFDTSLIEQELIGNQTGLTIQYFDSDNNPLPSPLPILFQNTEPFSQTINIRVEDVSNPICYSETSFDLIVNELPIINLEDEYFICNLEPSITLNIDSTFDSYNWVFEDGSLISSTNITEISEEGHYTLTVTQIENGIICENSFDFTLIRSVLPEIHQVNFGELGNNYIEIIASGDGDFEYSINGINYQDSNYFSNIQGAIYTVFVRDKDGCGQDSEEVTVIDYPKFFTPNNDGYNDFWQIKGIVNFPNSETLIFDRYGKLLARITSNDLGWNGLYNGKQMMSNDYWFRTDLGNGRTFSGHFSLKR
ncbi:T9SS type B sorting domain-containing protein [Corallibacter sp.]|uniref:T9SS type B sorting domain-containing protein n=1 Tax=Corallibacter sp. TaxID=2038084 RepID=UPI003AB8F4BC